MTSPLRILVVEDDAQMLGYLCALLASWGYNCDPAKSATDALVSAELRCPDVVVSDLLMPGMGGVELLESLKSVKARCASCTRKSCPMYFILITGHGSVSEAVRAIMGGADEVLLKPIKETALLQLLQRVDAQRGEASCSS